MGKPSDFDHSFLHDFTESHDVVHDPESKYAVYHDKWDKGIYDSLLKEMRELEVARQSLEDFTPTGTPAIADTWYSLVKAIPELKDAGKIRPDHLVNRAVSGQMMTLKEWLELRAITVGDPIGTAISVIGMEPMLEVLFDQLNEEQKLAQSMQSMLDEQIDLEAKADAINAAIARAKEGEGEGDPEDLQQQQELIKEALKKIKEKMNETAHDLEKALEGKSLGVHMAIREMLEKTRDQAEYQDKISKMWGIEPGVLMKMPLKERMELAKKIDTQKFRDIVDIFGPAKNLAMAEQMRKFVHSTEEVYELTYGSDLTRVLPAEFLTLGHPVLRFDWMRRYLSNQLLMYELKGTEKVARGGIIAIQDSSGSMAGERDAWATAISLCMLHIARLQKRSFYGMLFGDPGELMRFDFRDINNIDIDQICDYAQAFMNSGTDFMTPLSAALDILQEEYDKYGCVQGDIVFITDGQCGVDDEWFAAFKKKQTELGFRVFGVAIECARTSSPLYEICDGRVITVRDILTGRDVVEIFGSI